MAETIRFSDMVNYRQEELKNLIGDKTTPVRIPLCQHCHSSHVRKVVSHFGQVDLICKSCDRWGPWRWRATVRNPNAPKKGKKNG